MAAKYLESVETCHRNGFMAKKMKKIEVMKMSNAKRSGVMKSWHERMKLA
jgi:hypothetical protein